MLVATLWMVFCRCSTDLISQQRRAELVLHVGAGLVGVLGRALVEQPPVGRADAQLRQAVLVEHGHVLIVHLDDVDVRNDVLRRLRVVAAARLRIEMLDDLDVVLELLDRQAQLPRQLGNLVVLQQAQVLGDDALGGRALEIRGAAAAASGIPAGRAPRRRSGRTPGSGAARSRRPRPATAPCRRSRRPTRPGSRRRRGCR